MNELASASLINNSSELDAISPELIDVCPVISVFAVVPVDITVPDSLGKFIVLSAVGSTTPSVVSFSSSVEPSNIIVSALNRRCNC